MANVSLPEITLDELARLVRLLGMLGSGSDGEALNAARFAAKWVREHDTSWEVLLTPEPEAAVVAVATVPDEDAQAAAIEAAYQDGLTAGIKRGMEAMATQVKAQATMAAGQPGWQSFNPRNPATWLNAGPGNPLGAPASAASSSGAQNPQGPVRAPAAPAGGYPPGSWQAVAQELLDRHAAVPGVLRSREETFVQDVLRRGFPTLTAAQEHWLRDIAGRAGLSW